jgi:glycerophosphodiester phosphodiesterase
VLTYTAPSLDDLRFFVDVYDGDGALVGRAFFESDQFESKRGYVSVPVVSPVTLKSAGKLKARFLVVTPAPLEPAATTVNLPSPALVGQRLFFKSRPTLSCAHRGTGANRTSIDEAHIHENTLGALMRGSRAGADLLEFDVQLSRDEVPILFHDGYIAPSFTPSGFETPLSRLTHAELKFADA